MPTLGYIEHNRTYQSRSQEGVHSLFNLFYEDLGREILYPTLQPLPGAFCVASV